MDIYSNYGDQIDRISQGMLQIVQLKSPTDFREACLDFLKKESHFIENHLYRFPLTSNPMKGQLHALFQKIKENSGSEDYVIRDFKEGPLGRVIPVLEISSSFKEEERLRHQLDLGYLVKEVGSKEEADFLTQELAAMPIPWDYREGCYARADIGCRLLGGMLVPIEKIKKIWIKGQIQRAGVDWNWHMAPLIISRSGKKFVIDPAVNKIEALTVKQWRKVLMTKDVKFEWGEISSDYMYRPAINKQLQVSEEIFEVFKKMLHFQLFQSLIIEGFQRFKKEGDFNEEYTGDCISSYPRKSLLLEIAEEHMSLPDYAEPLEGEYKEAPSSFYDSRSCCSIS